MRTYLWTILLVLLCVTSAQAYLLEPTDARYARAVAKMQAGDMAGAALLLAELREDLEAAYADARTTSPAWPDGVRPRMELLSSLRQEAVAVARAGGDPERVDRLVTRIIEIDPATPVRAEDQVPAVKRAVETRRAEASEGPWLHVPRLITTIGEPGVLYVVTPDESDIRDMYLYVTRDLDRMAARIKMKDVTSDGTRTSGRIWSGEMGTGLTKDLGTVYYSFEGRRANDWLVGGVTWYACEVIRNVLPENVQPALVALDGRVHSPQGMASLARIPLVQVFESGSTTLPAGYEGVDTEALP